MLLARFVRTLPLRSTMGFAKRIGFVVVVSILLRPICVMAAEPKGGENVGGSTLVYAGTYTGGKSKSQGIYLFRLQTQNLEVSQNIMLVPLGLAAETQSPSFIELDPKRRLLF